MKKKKLLLFALLIFPLFCFAQLNIGGKGSVRMSDIKLQKREADRIKNSGEGSKKADYDKVKLSEETPDDMSVTIVNPYDTKIQFAFSTSDRMKVVEMEPYSFWTGLANDYWQNFIIITKDKQRAYSLKTNFCYTIFWDKSLDAWSVKPLKCNMYKK